MRELVAGLYVVGGILTALGVVLAYRRARRDLRRLERVAALHESHADSDPLEDYEATLAGENEGVAARKALRERQQEDLNQAVADAGVTGGAPEWKDLQLPMEYWAKRSALRDAVASFRSGGLIALAGLAISTVASVWSLYLPAAVDQLPSTPAVPSASDSPW